MLSDMTMIERHNENKTKSKTCMSVYRLSKQKV